MTHLKRNIKIALLPCLFALLSFPAIESLADFAYFYGSVFALVIALVFRQEHIYIVILCAAISLPILFIPCLYNIKGLPPNWAWKISKVFAVLNGSIGFLVTWGKWY
jgi:hypothetical protein